MKALSIKQPWAWLILHGGKDMENRTWKSNFRGEILIHASAGMTRYEYDAAKVVSYGVRGPNAKFPTFEEFRVLRGGIVGQITITGWTDDWTCSEWFFGPYAFTLANPKPLPFRPLKGQLGFFEVAV